jgi:hypothetical protein
MGAGRSAGPKGKGEACPCIRRACPLGDDLRLAWEWPAPPGKLTPARVRRRFRNIRATLPRLAGAPKPGKPGKTRLRTAARIEEPPPSTRPRRGETAKRKLSLKARPKRAG